MKKLHAYILISALAVPAAVAMAQKPMGNMGDMGNMAMGTKPEAGAKGAHKASATVKKLDAKAGVVTLSHGPVATLNWPAMTMTFKVKDKSLLPKLAEGKKVDVELTKDGEDYVVTSVK